MEEFEAFLAESIGRALRQARDARGLSQARLADVVDATTEYVSLLERGARIPSVSMLCRLSLALEIPVARLLGEEPVTQSSDEGEALLRAVPEKERPAVLGMLRALAGRSMGA